MTDPIIKTIVKLFSIISNISPDSDLEENKEILKAYLAQYVKNEKLEEFTAIFDFYNTQYSDRNDKNFYKEISLKSVKTLRLINEINKSLVYNKKVLLLAHLTELLKSKTHIIPDEYDFLQTISLSFNIPTDEFEDLKAFILYSCDQVIHKERLLMVFNRTNVEKPRDNKIIQRDNLNGHICFLYLPSSNLFIFYYYGQDTLFLNGQIIKPQKIYKFSKGNSISSYKMGLQNVKLKPIHYTELAQSFITTYSEDYVELIIDNIEFYYKNQTSGIKPFRFKTESFLFVGVIGSSGVGKSTLLNILNGNLKPRFGSVRLNGFDVHENIEKLKGLIGYVPQDDLLFEELTVYENIYYNARLCFGDLDNAAIRKKVDNIIEELDLAVVGNSKVGNPLEKYISGGQRKRINLALELIREPSILLVDEPTSGLSSSDSMKIINLLREQTLKGKLVIANIHQPSSNIFKLFDQLIVLDEGGTPIYTGDPMEGLVYFKTINEQVNAQEKECPACGSINPELILEITEDEEVDEQGNYTGTRKKTPDQWYQLYKENIEKEIEKSETNKKIPQNPFRRPNIFNQLKIFIARNIITKLNNKQYLFISLLEAPVLAVILGFFTKYTAGTANNEFAYIFSKNENLPSYLLMSIIVALFVGMLISADEIIKDRKVLEREKFLKLSRSGYLLSKIILLIIISAIQVLTFVLIGNTILEIKGLNFEYWLILFSIAVFANLTGLNISSGLKSEVAIYILIPFLLIPQILLSGTIVKFDKLHGKLTTELYPPLVADLMVSRWSYEALAVVQFKENAYEKHFYEIEKDESELYYKTNILIPKIMQYLDEIRTGLIIQKQGKSNFNNEIKLINNELKKIAEEYPELKLKNRLVLNNKNITPDQADQISNQLILLRKKLANQLERVLYRKDKILRKLIEKKGGLNDFNAFKADHHNTSISELVKRKDNPEKIIEKNHHLYRKAEPIYITSNNWFARTQFYAPQKQLVNNNIDTFWFNFAIIWIFNLVLYIALYKDWLRKGITILKKD